MLCERYGDEENQKQQHHDWYREPPIGARGPRSRKQHRLHAGGCIRHEIPPLQKPRDAAGQGGVLGAFSIPGGVT
jgi:hypothetical protein